MKRNRFVCSRTVNNVAIFTGVTAVLLLVLMMTALASSSAFSGHSPGKSATVNISNPTVSVYVKSTTNNNLNANSVTATLNGVPVTASILFKGYWESDYDTGELFYVITSQKEGTISFETTELVDGPHIINVSIKDTAGNVFSDTWTFTVAEPPKITNIFPMHQSELKSVGSVSATVNDNGSIDWNAGVMKINGSVVSFSIEGNTVTHTRNFTSGTYQVSLTAKDTTGLTAQQSWSFLVDPNPPALTSLQSFTDGMKIVDGILRFSAQLNDAVDIKDNVSLLLNGTPLNIDFRYKGEWNYDGDEYFIHSRKEAYVDYQGAVSIGNHTLSLYAEDKLGNHRTYNWTFSVIDPPQITNVSPAHQTEQQNVSSVSATILDNGSVDLSTVQMQINGSEVNVIIEDTTVTHIRNFSSGTYHVNLTVQDEIGQTAQQSWSFLVDSNPPDLTSLQYFTDGMNLSDGILRFYAQLSDAVDIKENVTLSLNGTPLNIDFRFKGEWSYDGDIYFVHSRKEAYVDYEIAVPNGTHALSLYAEDKLGNHRTFDWTFTVASPPVISKKTPVAYGVKTLTPVISAKVEGLGASLDPDQIILKFNGVTVEHSYNPENGIVSYIPTVPLENEGYYEVNLTVTDTTNFTTSGNWKFYINTYPDMADSNINNCQACHDLFTFSGSAGPFEDIHGQRLSFFDDHSTPWDCERCHNYITVAADCQQCHGDVLNVTPEYSYAPHGSTPSIDYQLKNFEPNFPIRILNNREMWDCAICHQPGVDIPKKSGGSLNNHDIPELHKSEAASCNICHARSLTREHARDNRFDKNEGLINCNTCHTSAKENVLTAIASKNKTCNACHAFEDTGGAHAELHYVEYGLQCNDCHGDNMMLEQIYHQSDCNTCHTSTDPVVQNAILWQKDSCFDCHGEAHGVSMAVFRDDIPLYNEVVWGTPQVALIWSDDGWLPEELDNEGAKVIFSGRADLDKAAVHQYYLTEMTGMDWIVLENTYSQGNNYFMLKLQKDRRYAAVWFYYGSQPNTDGDTEQGARLTVVYH